MLLQKREISLVLVLIMFFLPTVMLLMIVSVMLEMLVVQLESDSSKGGVVSLMTKQQEERMKNAMKTKNSKKNCLLTKLFHLTLSKSTMTYSIKSKCSSFCPNTMRLRADTVCSSPV